MLHVHVNLCARFGMRGTTMSENELSVLAVPKNLGTELDFFSGYAYGLETLVGK